MPPLINILIRTTGTREASFKRCLQSVLSQTHKNVRIIVSYDCENVPNYIPHGFINDYTINERGNTFSHPITTIKTHKTTEYGYNLYCNDLKAKVNDGYFIFLDDDDVLHDNRALERIIPHLSPNYATICQMLRSNRAKPLRGEIVSGRIGMPCIILHHSHKNIASFDDSHNADYKFIKEVSEKVPVKFTPTVVVRCDKRGYGK